MEYFVREPIVKSRQMGFALLEMAIVLAIIGLIVGSIVIGSDMIRSGELQSVIADTDRFKKAVTLFRDKYSELPGDFSRATSVWGTDPGGCPAAGTPANAVRKTATCNGNGDGNIGYLTTFAAGQDSWEMLRAWQQLSNAGLIDQIYVGTVTTQANAAGGFYQAGWNVPSSKLRNGMNGYRINYMGPDDGSSANTFAAEYGHVIVYDKFYRASAADPVAYALTPAEALSIDRKADDGNAASGKVLSYKAGDASLPQCLAAQQYNAAANINAFSCRLIFITGW